MTVRAGSLPMSGPCCQLTPAEAARVALALAAARDELAVAIVAKCDRALASDPKWRTPTT